MVWVRTHPRVCAVNDTLHGALLSPRLGHIGARAPLIEWYGRTKRRFACTGTARLARRRAIVWRAFKALHQLFGLRSAALIGVARGATKDGVLDTTGVSLPDAVGIFIPTLAIGAALGRLAGRAVRGAFQVYDINIQVGEWREGRTGRQGCKMGHVPVLRHVTCPWE